MNEEVKPLGLEPVVAIDTTLQRRPLGSGAGIRVNVRGRSIRLRGLRRPPTGVFRWLAMLGPGIVAGNAGNDAGAIATYSQVGAKYGYDLLWLLLLITLSLAVVQEMSGRLGAATGRGLLDLIRERFGIRWSCFAIGLVFVANMGLIISEFVGIGAAFELLGISRYVAVPVAAILIWYLITAGSYSWVERTFVAMTVVFFAYPAAALLSRPHWNEVAHAIYAPGAHVDRNYLLLLVALLGTTITPYQQLFQQSSVVEKGVGRQHYGPERIDTYVGSVLSSLIAAFIVIAAAATLHVMGQTNIDSAAAAARALEPAAGSAAKVLFAVGLLGASLLSAAVLPIATAYSINETFGFPKGVNLSFRQARMFFGLFTALIIVGAALALIPGVPVIQLLVGIQVLNGILLPVLLVFLLLLSNDRKLMRGLKNSRWFNILGWGTFVLVALAVAVLLGTQFLDLVGLNVFGGS